MNRITFFCHWDKNNLIDDYVIEYLKGLNKVSKEIIFISNCNLSGAERKKVVDYTTDIIIRENIGYDFMAWQEGLRYKGYENLYEYDEVIIANDSCYAPLHDLTNMFFKMEQRQCDFWGVSQSLQIKQHLQSYFLAFRKNLFINKVFKEFWESIVIGENKIEIVQKYEVGLTSFFSRTGFVFSSFMNCKINYIDKIKIKCHMLLMIIRNKGRIPKANYSKKSMYYWNKYLPKKILEFFNLNKIDPMRFFWDKLIISGCPFIKIDVLRDNRYMLKSFDNWETLIKEHTNYDIELIKSHLKRNIH